MPVITPAYPSMCATFNITRSSMAIINRELQRGLEITEAIMVGKRPWSDLFAKHTFFTTDYRYYISVTTASKDREAHRIWSGYVESKVRMLVQKLELHPSISLARPFNKGYDRRHHCKSDKDIAQVQEGCLDFMTTSDEDAACSEPATEKPEGPAQDGDAPKPAAPTTVYTTTHYIGLQLVPGKRYTSNAKLCELGGHGFGGWLLLGYGILTSMISRCQVSRLVLPGG